MIYSQDSADPFWSRNEKTRAMSVFPGVSNQNHAILDLVVNLGRRFLTSTTGEGSGHHTPTNQPAPKLHKQFEITQIAVL